MTTQEAYEYMRIYFGREGARRAVPENSSEGSNCRYEIELDGDKHRCAVGCLLSPSAIDELYERDLMSAGIDEMVSWNLLAGEELEGVDVIFLRKAQNLHDHHWNWDRGQDYIINRLDRIAARCGLRPVTATAVEAGTAKERVPVLA